LLELRGLQKRYESTVALDDCSFSVERGRVLGFLGRNGAGKTTAMRSIFGLVPLDGGTMRWEGKPVDREARYHFGYMPEERGLYPRMSVQTQLEYFGELRGLDAAAARRESERWMQRLDLAERRSSTVDSLSHGNQQKVQLAVSLIGDPVLLVLDEPFSGLDPIAVEVLSSVIREAAANGAAVVFSSHQLELVGDVCDDIAVITTGHVVLDGDLEQIRRRSPIRTLQLRLEGTDDGAWAYELVERLPDSKIEESDGDSARLTVGAATRPGDVLSALGELAPKVVEFRLEPPDLERVFREAAGEPV
jgi:ABC-2 type transport system ATP-binding protein